jgi:hypothetical protein
MAILNSQTAGNGATVPLALQLSGPLFPLEIHVPVAFAQLLTANQQPVPAPIMGFALIDTGATSSCVDQQSMLSLGVSPIGIHRSLVLVESRTIQFVQLNLRSHRTSSVLRLAH